MVAVVSRVEALEARVKIRLIFSIQFSKNSAKVVEGVRVLVVVDLISPSK